VINRPRRISKAESEDKKPAGKMLGIKPTASAVVCVQVIDLSAAGIPAGKRPLRLRLSLTVGGSTMSRAGGQIVIEGTGFAGAQSASGPEWEGGELHLQNLFVQEEGRLATYDIVVVQSK
jgi:hypothetical protein